MRLKCERCGYEWEVSPDPREDLPDQCARVTCKSNFWDIPRKLKSRSPVGQPENGT